MRLPSPLLSRRVLRFQRVYAIDVSCASSKTSRELSSHVEGAGIFRLLGAAGSLLLGQLGLESWFALWSIYFRC